TLSLGSEAFCVAHEIGIGEIARNQPVAVLLLLGAPHVAEGTIVEHDGGQRYAMAHSGGKLVRGEEKAAVARDRKHRHIGAGGRWGGGGGVAEPQPRLSW